MVYQSNGQLNFCRLEHWSPNFVFSMTDSALLHTIPTYFSKIIHPKDTDIEECPFPNSAVRIWNENRSNFSFPNCHFSSSTLIWFESSFINFLSLNSWWPYTPKKEWTSRFSTHTCVLVKLKAFLQTLPHLSQIKKLPRLIN